MKVIDLTQAISPEMPVYPGTETPDFVDANTYDRDGFKETKISFYTHTGTHVDPPVHLFPNRTALDEFPISQFIGKALVIDCTMLQEGEYITKEQLLPYANQVEQADFLLFHLGWDKFWGSSKYFEEYPCIDEEVLSFIMNSSLKGIGFDTIGLDPVSDLNLTRHRALFAKKDILNIENLKNLHLCGSELFWFSCFPLKIENADGSPVRAVAWFI